MRCNDRSIYKTSHGCMEFFRAVFRACCLHGEQIRFLLSVRPEDAKRKCGLHWLDKRVTTSPVFLYDGEIFCSGNEREENCNNTLKRLSPSPFDFNFSKPSSTKGMKYKMKSWEIKKKKKKIPRPKNRTGLLCSRQLRPSCEQI